MTQTLVSEPTAKQLSFLGSLLDDAVRMLGERERVTGCEWPEATVAVSRMRDTEGRTRKEVSAMIDTAMDNNRQLRSELDGLGWVPANPAPAEPVAFVTTGMYQVDGRIFKVLPSRNSDRHYAKELVGETETGFAFEYARGAMRMIRPEHKMTAEQAQEFGKLTGSCCCCGRLLTDPNSIADGIGPVCKGKYFV